MLLSRAKTTASRTGLRRVRRVDVDHPQARRFSLVLHKLLELKPCPTVQPGTDTLSGFDTLADIGQLLHHDGRSTRSNRFLNNRFTHVVVHVANVAGFTARDLSQELFGRLGAVALKPATKGKEFVSLVAKVACGPQI